MRIGRHPSEEETAWKSLLDAWDASVGELKVKVDRAKKAAAADEVKEVDDDEGR